jgi:hypothetical protein
VAGHAVEFDPDRRPFVQALLKPSNLIDVSREQRIAGTQDEAGWEPFKDGLVSVGSAADAANPVGPTLWSWTVTLPGARVPGQFRVVIIEREHLLTDVRVVVPSVEVRVPGDPDGGHPHIEHRTLTFTPGNRLVLAEAVEI